MGTTRSGSPLLRAMIEDSTEEVYKDSRGEGVSSLPFSQRHDTGAKPAPIHRRSVPVSLSRSNC
jgi:hypothetical protein